MPSCPVCEHTQAVLDACEVCGWALSDPAPPPTEDLSAPLADLERTALVDGTLDGELPPMDLLPAAPDAPSAFPPEADLAIEPMPDLEPTGAPPTAPTPRVEVAACRYCRTPVPPGAAFCDTCGMRTRHASAAEVPGAPAETWRCPVCFARAEGARCGACGARAPGLAP